MHETIDILDRDKFITLLYQLISTMSDHRTGKMFAIDGTWGYGKTFVLEKLEKRLSDEINC